MPTIIYLFMVGIMFAFTACGDGSSSSSSACSCLEEFNTLRINSSLYQSCINKAISAGEAGDPYGYFERKCDK